MEKVQRKRMLWRIPLLVTILVAVFWGIWYLASGEIPVVSQIKWIEDTTIQLPFPISRLWDVLPAFIGTFLLVSLFTQKKIEGNRELVAALVVVLVVVLVVGLVFVLKGGLGIILGLSVLVILVFGLVVGLVYGRFAGLVASLVAGLGFGLGAGLVVGLGVGLVVGLVVDLATILVISPVTGLITVLRFFFSTKTWHLFCDWVAGKS